MDFIELYMELYVERGIGYVPSGEFENKFSEIHKTIMAHRPHIIKGAGQHHGHCPARKSYSLGT